MALPLRDQRHQYLMFDWEYLDADIIDFEEMLGKIYRRGAQSLFTGRAWRRLFEVRGPLVHELILEFFSTFRFGKAVLGLDTVGALHIDGRSQAPEKEVRFREETRAMISGDQFVSRLAEYFGLLTEQRLQGLMFIAPDLPVIDMAELRNTAPGAPEVVSGAPVVDEGVPAVLAPVHAPQPPPAAGPAKTLPQRVARLEEEVHGMREALGEQRDVLDGAGLHTRDIPNP
ncbi:hypothetical protein Tco_1178743 [Tanacetum coccineum]